MSVRAIVMAAGKGTRMKSARPKVLHELCGRPMLWYVLRALRDANVVEIVVVVNEELRPHVAGVAAGAAGRSGGAGRAARAATRDGPRRAGRARGDSSRARVRCSCSTATCRSSTRS